ncbi:hypothetical protein [Nocardiopsis potens]|uniref:hypothetical protein n=1 Tax=Nocardiopsis potens TaxID=1246458 RepID=UPI00034A2F83|nr:hypothetical protein [Nocardiopsis potens]
MGFLFDIFSEMFGDAVTVNADKAVMSAQSRKVHRFAAESGLHYAPLARSAPHAAPALGELGALGVPVPEAPEQARDVVTGAPRRDPGARLRQSAHLALHP